MPTKAIYSNFEDNPAEEFDFFLALKLGMTVGRLRREMSAAEWHEWYVYFGRRAQERELAAAGG